MYAIRSYYDSVQHTIDIIFSGVDDVLATADKIGGKLAGFGGGIGEIADPFAKIANSILGIDAALAASAVGVIALRSEFDSELGKIQAGLGTTAERAEQLGDIAKEA